MKKLLINTLIAGAIFISQSVSATPTAKEIMQKVLDRDDGKTSYSQSQLMSCRFKVKDGKYKCISKPRVKQFEGLNKDIGDNLKDSRGLNIIIKPASEKGMAFLQNDYDDNAKDSQQWMYLPAMRKLKRIISETDDGAKTGSLFGSELSYEDIEKRHINDYTYELLKESTQSKRPVWVIKSTPTPQQATKTSYSYTKNWVDKDRLLVLKIEMYDRQGKLKKTLLNQRVQKVDGIWVAKQLLILNHANQRMSMMRTTKMALNIDVPDALLGTRMLNDASFRESQLKPIRAMAK